MTKTNENNNVNTAIEKMLTKGVIYIDYVVH